MPDDVGMGIAPWAGDGFVRCALIDPMTPGFWHVQTARAVDWLVRKPWRWGALDVADVGRVLVALERLRPTFEDELEVLALSGVEGEALTDFVTTARDQARWRHPQR